MTEVQRIKKNSTTLRAPQVCDLVLVHTDDHGKWVLGRGHPTQGRRFVNGYRAIVTALCELDSTRPSPIHVITRDPQPRASSIREMLELIHDSSYVAEVLDHYTCFEWSGQRQDLSQLASLFVTGTLDAMDALVQGETLTAVHLPGGKHHAHRDHSSGFCVFNDFAIAATCLTQQGKRVAILDIDAHHGDGTEALLCNNLNVLTFSTHEQGIFPGTGPHEDDNGRHVHNRPVPANSDGETLLHWTNDFTKLATPFNPDIIFVAAGADGHLKDPLSSLRYTEDWYHRSGEILRRSFPSTPILIAGSGGYRPDDATPATWAAFVSAVVTGANP
jgi:acetoin utilization deacetylase AcuC-like enzyme